MKRFFMAATALLISGAFAASAGTLVVEDFEYASGLPAGTDTNGNPTGYFVFGGSGTAFTNIGTTTTPPSQPPSSPAPNTVLSVTTSTTSFSGFVNYFTNAVADTWISQDWSNYTGLSFDIFGTGSGTQLFFDILDNRGPGSTTDDAERFTLDFMDDVAGWRTISFSFAEMVRKDIGNGAPNDGLNLTEMWGFAFGNRNTSGEYTYLIDNVHLTGQQVPPVPLPASVLMLGAAIGGLVALRRRQRIG